MLSKEEVEALQTQVAEEYKYLFDWDDEHTDYEDYITDGQPDLEKIKAAHELTLVEHPAFFDGIRSAADFWSRDYYFCPHKLLRYHFYKPTS